MLDGDQRHSHPTSSAPTCTDARTTLRRELDRLATLVRQHSLDAAEWMAVASTVRDLITHARAEHAVSPVPQTAPVEFDKLEPYVAELTARLRASAIFNHQAQERDAAA